MNSNFQIPSDLEITLENIISCNIDNVLSQAEEKSYSAYYLVLNRAFEKEKKDLNVEPAYIFSLLANVCSLILKPESNNQPYIPFLTFHNTQPIAIENFLEKHLMNLEIISNNIQDNMIRARIFDLLWILKKPREYQNALSAIDEFKKIPLKEDETITSENSLCWKRCIRICLQLGNSVQNQLNETRSYLLELIKTISDHNPNYLISLSELLLFSQLKEIDQIDTIIEKLHEHTNREKEQEGWLLARELLFQCQYWHERKLDVNGIYEISKEIALLFINEASKCKPEDAMIAAHFYENAILSLRSIPNKFRNQLGIDALLDDCQHKMTESNKLSLDFMTYKSSGNVDISYIVEQSKKIVENKTLEEALISFVSINPIHCKSEIQKIAIEDCKRFLYLQIFPTISLSNDGRIIFRSTGYDANNPESDESKIALFSQMVKIHLFNIQFITKSQIMPAYEILTNEHRITENFLLSICQTCHLLPHDQVLFFSRGLFQGFEQNFDIALFLLTPQIESLVRTILKRNGIITTVLDSNQIEKEKGLSSLLEIDGINNIIGENSVFELKALLTDPNGPNLRNDVAHGLLSWYNAMTFYSVYLWWFILRLVILNSSWFDEWKNLNKQEPKGNEK